MKRAAAIAISLVLPLTALAGWHYICLAHLVPAALLAPPYAVLVDFASMVRDGTLLSHCLASLSRLGLGFCAGALAGLIGGVIVAVSPIFSRLAEPSIAVLAPIPPIAWVPFIIMLLGVDDPAKVALIAVGTFFIVVVHTAHGIRATPQDYVELANVLGKNKAELLFYILIPNALPEIFTGLRISMGLCWTLLLVSEIIASSNGLGWMIWDARNFSRPDDLIVGMMIVGILGRFTDLLLLSLEKYATRWKATYEQGQQYAN